MTWSPLEIWTPSEIEAYIANVGSGFDALANDVQKAGASYANAKAAALAIRSFREWRGGITWLSELTLSPLRTAESWAKTLQYWRDDFTRLTGKQASGMTVALPGSDSTSATTVINKALTLAALGVGVYALTQVLSTVRAFKRA